jgi:hypothetical protein
VLLDLALDENDNIFDRFLPKMSENCKICNPKFDAVLNDVFKTTTEEAEICERCGNDVKFSFNITDVKNDLLIY